VVSTGYFGLVAPVSPVHSSLRHVISFHAVKLYTESKSGCSARVNVDRLPFFCSLVTCLAELVSHLGFAGEEAKSATVCRQSRDKVWLERGLSEVKKELSFWSSCQSQMNVLF
jgi:hypothetical protein